MNSQRTLRRPVSCSGIGLHSGNKVTLSLKPAPADYGIRFQRSDLGGLEIPATVTHRISVDHPLIRHQSRTMKITDETFVEEIAPARTFGFLKEVEMLRQRGLALGGSLDNAIVLGETGVLNNALRFEDEFVRHKILDVIGDLSLVGYPVIGHLVAHRGGHALHTAFAARILEEVDASRIVEGDTAPAVTSIPIGVPAAKAARLAN